MHFTDVDDVDVLFGRLDREPPPADLHDRVMGAIAARARARRRLGCSVVAAALALVSALSFVFGRELQTAGTLALLATIVEDSDVFSSATTDIFFALIEMVPWQLALLSLMSAGVATWATRLVRTPSVGRWRLLGL